MGRNARDNRPHIRPVEKIELSEGNALRRAIAAALLLILGAGALAYSFSRLLAPEPGWQAIEAASPDGPTCAEEFTLLYELGAGGEDPRSENRRLAEVYAQACQAAFRLFHTVERFEGVTNLCDINAQPNRTLSVDPALYRAFEAVGEAGDRTVYLGPVWARYGDLFFCQDDSQIGDFDPWTSEAVAEEYAAAAAYAGDPAHIGVELLGGNRIRLRVSEEYLAYAAREGIDRFLDFGWMRNAFAADYLADTLAEAGFTRGVLSSYDGFARCLDGRDTPFTLNLYGWEEDRPIEAGTVQYQGPMSVVSLRGFPVVQEDWRRFYQLKDGQLRTPFLDPADGKCRASVDSLVCWSGDAGCARLAMAAAPVFIAGELDPAPLEKMAGEGIYALWCVDRVFFSTSPSLDIQNLYQTGGIVYSQAGPK